jgi:quercetin dioxygenase-like cupin family protein
MQYVYDFAALDRTPDNPTSAQVTPRRLLSGPDLKRGKSSTVGAVLKGEHIILTLGTQARGTGARPHTHPNEQFNYMLQGTMTWEIGDELIFAGPGQLMHTPAMAVHTGLACPDEDTIFLAMKDTRHGIVGPPVDGVYNGPNYLPGFGTREREPVRSTAQLIADAGRDPAGVGTRYVYDLDQLDEKPGRVSTAAVAQRPDMSTPGISGPVITGEKLHIAVLRYEPGARSGQRNAAERFAFIVAGSLSGEVNGQAVTVRERCIVHLPAGVPHQLSASNGASVVVVQDNRAPFAA